MAERNLRVDHVTICPPRLSATPSRPLLRARGKHDASGERCAFRRGDAPKAVLLTVSGRNSGILRSRSPRKNTTKHDAFCEIKNSAAALPAGLSCVSLDGAQARRPAVSQKIRNCGRADMRMSVTPQLRSSVPCSDATGQSWAESWCATASPGNHVRRAGRNSAVADMRDVRDSGITDLRYGEIAYVAGIPDYRFNVAPWLPTECISKSNRVEQMRLDTRASFGGRDNMQISSDFGCGKKPEGTEVAGSAFNISPRLPIESFREPYCVEQGGPVRHDDMQVSLDGGCCDVLHEPRHWSRSSFYVTPRLPAIWKSDRMQNIRRLRPGLRADRDHMQFTADPCCGDVHDRAARIAGGRLDVAPWLPPRI